jgi:hypothetical protein
MFVGRREPGREGAGGPAAPSGRRPDGARPPRVRPGQWASYKEGDRTVTLAAVAAAGDSMWIELIEDGDPRLVSARLVSPDGVVRKAFYGEVSKDGNRSTVEPQTLEQNGTSSRDGFR